MRIKLLFIALISLLVLSQAPVAQAQIGTNITKIIREILKPFLGPILAEVLDPDDLKNLKEVLDKVEDIEDDIRELAFEIKLRRDPVFKALQYMKEQARKSDQQKGTDLEPQVDSIIAAFRAQKAGNKLSDPTTAFAYVFSVVTIDGPGTVDVNLLLDEVPDKDKEDFVKVMANVIVFNKQCGNFQIFQGEAESDIAVFVDVVFTNECIADGQLEGEQKTVVNVFTDSNRDDAITVTSPGANKNEPEKSPPVAPTPEKTDKKDPPPVVVKPGKPGKLTPEEKAARRAAKRAARKAERKAARKAARRAAKLAKRRGRQRGRKLLEEESF